jgi:hypothetical protein
VSCASFGGDRTRRDVPATIALPSRRGEHLLEVHELELELADERGEGAG